MRSPLLECTRGYIRLTDLANNGISAGRFNNEHLGVLTKTTYGPFSYKN